MENRACLSSREHLEQVYPEYISNSPDHHTFTKNRFAICKPFFLHLKTEHVCPLDEQDLNGVSWDEVYYSEHIWKAKDFTEQTINPVKTKSI